MKTKSSMITSLVMSIAVIFGMLATATTVAQAAPRSSATFAKTASKTAVKSSSGGLPRACRGRSGKLICASKSAKRVYLVRSGRIVASARARFGGRASDGSGPWFTREGTFRILYKDSNAFSTLYHVYMPYFMAFSGGQGFHYSSEYAGGYPYSHGCVGFARYRFARKAFRWAPTGTKVVVTRY